MDSDRDLPKGAQAGIDRLLKLIRTRDKRARHAVFRLVDTLQIPPADMRLITQII